MRRAGLLLLVGALAAGCGASHQARGPQVIALGVYNVGGDAGFEATALVKLRHKSLEPYGNRLRLGDAATGGKFSPNRKTLGLGTYNDGNVLLVDPARLRLVKKIHVLDGRDGGDVQVDVLGWPRPDLIVAETTFDRAWWSPHPSTLVFVDPRRGEVLRRAPVGGSVEQSVTLGDGTIALLRLGATFGGATQGTPAVVTVTPGGRIHAVVLRRLRLLGPDAVHVDGETFRAERVPGIATDGRRVFVVAADRPIAEVDVPSLAVRYHTIRLSDAHLPAPRATTPGSGGVHFRLSRSATWLGQGLLAVQGYDELPAHVPGFGAGHRELSTSVLVVDTHTWRLVRTVPATGCARAADMVLCAGDVAAKPTGLIGEVDTDLVAYDRRWHVRYRHGPRPLYWQLVGARLLVNRIGGSGPTFELDRRTGENLGRVRPPRYADSFLIWHPPD